MNMNDEKFPLTLAAVKKGETSLWDIGDALIKECGSGNEKLRAASQYLLDNGGYEYSQSYLFSLQLTAFNFPKNARKPGIAFATHRVAGSPKVLEALIKGTPSGTNLSQHYVENVLSAQRRGQEAMKRAAEAKAQAERERAEAKQAEAERKVREAKDAKERAQAAKEAVRAAKETRQAEREERKARSAPIKKSAPPEPEEVHPLAVETSAFANVAEVTRLARVTRKAIEPEIDQWKASHRQGLIESILEAINQWRAVAELLEGKGSGSKHLHVVGE